MNSQQKETKGLWWQPGLILFTRLSGWIGGPVIIALFIGKWLDRKYGTDPILFLVCVGLAFFVSSYGIVKDSLAAMKQIEKEADEAKKGKDNNTGKPDSNRSDKE